MKSGGSWCQSLSKRCNMRRGLAYQLCSLIISLISRVRKVAPREGLLHKTCTLAVTEKGTVHRH